LSFYSNLKYKGMNRRRSQHNVKHCRGSSGFWQVRRLRSNLVTSRDKTL